MLKAFYPMKTTSRPNIRDYFHRAVICHVNRPWKLLEQSRSQLKLLSQSHHLKFFVCKWRIETRWSLLKALYPMRSTLKPNIQDYFQHAVICDFKLINATLRGHGNF